MTPVQSTSQFVKILRQEDDLLEIHEPVDPYLELAEIQRQVVARRGSAILFHQVKGSSFKVATNLYGSQKRIDLAFSKRPVEMIRQAVDFAQTAFPPTLKKLWSVKNLAWDGLKVGTRRMSRGPVLDCIQDPPQLDQLPQIQCWPEDGGPFVLLPLVYTQSPSSGKSNLGMYRVQIHNTDQVGLHIQIHRGGGFHYHEAEQRAQALPAHVYVGGPPALVIAAISPLPEDVPEILLASLLKGGRLGQIHDPKLSPLPILAEADFCLVGEAPPKDRLPEGPFGDHYGYYSLQHDYPYMNVKRLLHRRDAIYPATVVGRPPQEDHYIACYLQELLKPLIHLVMPQVKQVWAFEESGVHSLAGAVVHDRYPREALTTALRILGEGQLSLSKVLMVTDQDCDVKNFRDLFVLILERIDFERDLFVLSNVSQDTLDYTGPKVNEGSKAIFLGVGDKKRDLPVEFSGEPSLDFIRDIRVFCPGVLAIEVSSYRPDDGLGKLIASQKVFQSWPMVFLFDDAEAAVASNEDFIWHAFTRFEPAADIYAKETAVRRFHVGLKTPVVIDCRMKPWYPKVLETDEKVIQSATAILDRAN